MKKTKIFAMAMATMMSVGAMGVNALADTDTYDGSINDIQMQEENRVTTVDDSRLSVFDEENKTIIGNILDNGGEYFFYDHDAPFSSYMALGEEYINLPRNGAGEQHHFKGMYDDFTSYFIYRIQQKCTMKIYATCSINSSPAELQLDVLNADDLSKAFPSQKFTSSVEGETFTYSNVSVGDEYRIKVTNLSAGNPYIALNIYGE